MSYGHLPKGASGLYVLIVRQRLEVPAVRMVYGLKPLMLSPPPVGLLTWTIGTLNDRVVQPKAVSPTHGGGPYKGFIIFMRASVSAHMDERQRGITPAAWRKKMMRLMPGRNIIVKSFHPLNDLWYLWRRFESKRRISCEIRTW
jgi:hypothetical protein